MPQSQPYGFSTPHRCPLRQTVPDAPGLTEKLKMDVIDLMQQCDAPPARALVKGLARELKIGEQFL
jgi:hypothetical protein